MLRRSSMMLRIEHNRVEMITFEQIGNGVQLIIVVSELVHVCSRRERDLTQENSRLF
jgi:hypothetical protein